MFANRHRLTFTIIGLCISVALSAGNNCSNLDAALFGRCITAGIDASSVKHDSSAKDIADSLNKTITKFESCSPILADLMACSLYVPKCQVAEGASGEVGVFPCLEVCKAFVVQCDGIDFVRQLCGLLPTNNSGCLKAGDLKNISTVADNSREIRCEPVVGPCKDLGYLLTTLSSNAQQDLLKSDIMKKVENAAIPVKRLVCAELVPPCVSHSKDKLYRACKSNCTEASQNYSQQFTDIFNDTDYCSGLSDRRDEANGGQFCQLETWPKTGFWPGGLRLSLNLQGSINTTTPASPTNDTKAPTSKLGVETTTPHTEITTMAPTPKPHDITTIPPTANTIMTPTPKPHDNTAIPPTANPTTTPTSKPHDNTAIPPTANPTTTPTSKPHDYTTSPPTANPTTTPTSKPHDNTAIPPTATVPPTATIPPTTIPPTAKSTLTPTSKPLDVTTIEPTEQGKNATASPTTTNPNATNAPTHDNKSTTKAPVTTRPTTETAPSESSSNESTKTTAPTNKSTVRFSTTPRPRSTEKGSVHGKQTSQKKSRMSAGAIAGAAIGAILGIVLIVALVVFLIRRRKIALQYSHRVMVDMEDL